MEVKLRIKQIGESEFFIQKLITEIKISGCLWWEKKETIERWVRVDMRGRHVVDFNYIPCGIVTFETLKEAENWIKDSEKYPIYHYLTSEK